MKYKYVQIAGLKNSKFKRKTSYVSSANALFNRSFRTLIEFSKLPTFLFG